MRISQASAIVEAAIDNQIKLFATDNYRDAQLLYPYLNGRAGIGKTCTITGITARRDNWAHYIMSLAQFDAAELMGIIAKDGDKAVRLKPHWLTTVEELAAIHDVVVLFMDELPQSPIANMNVARQIINEHRAGEFPLPKNVAIVAAGNRVSDRAGANNIPSHLKDCLLFLNVEADVEDAVAYLNSVGAHPVVTAFMRYRPELLSKVDRDADSNASPRSMERLSSIISWGLDETLEREAVAGQIGAGNAAEFYGFKPVYEAGANDIDSILTNPDSAKVHEEPSVCYAVCSALAHRANDKNVGNVIKYLKRLPHKEFAVFTMKDAFNRHPSIKQTQAFREFLLSDGKELML